MAKTITIEIPNGKKAEWINGVLTLVDEAPKDIKERIKTFEDAYTWCRNNECIDLTDAYDNAHEWLEDDQKDVFAYLQLRIITAALNEGWRPKFEIGEQRWAPYFALYTQDDIDEMDEEKRARVVYRSLSGAYAYGGVSYAYADYDSADVNAYVGSRLAFKDAELAEYAGKQFTQIYADMLLEW